jgi:hypothetical protein
MTVRAAAQDQRQDDHNRDAAAQDQRHDDHNRYVDQRGEEHHWDANEDTAYRRWVKENHRKNEDFNHLNKKQQEEYWQWRREHPDQR